jgi:molybdenum cofactor biosynthesis enzyme
MAKSADRGMEITDLRLEQKSGGRSGDFRRADDDP